MTGRLLSYPLILDTVPSAGSHVRIEADKAQREAIARAYGLVAVTEFVADLEIRPWGGDGFEVKGRVSADLMQTCSVTLDPFSSQMSEEVDARFSPRAHEFRTPVTHEEEDGEGADLDAPEPLEGGVMDLGAVALEFFSLGLDPYPRKPGVTFEEHVEDPGGENPFAALAALQKQQNSP